MDHTLLNQKHHIKFRKSIAVLLIISLICKIISEVLYFLAYIFIDIRGLTIEFPSVLSLIMFFLNIISITLLILYVVKLYKKTKTAIFVPIFFSLQAISFFLSIISNYTNYIVEREIIDLFLLNATINLIFGIAFILSTTSALKGLYNKIFIMIPIILSFASALQNIYLFFAYSFEFFIDCGVYLLLIYYLAEYSSHLILLAALLLFGLKNRIVPIIPVSEQKRNKRLKKMKPQKALKFLNDELYFGIITDEEYQEKRSEIILYIQNNI